MAQNIPFHLFYYLFFQIVALWVLTGGDIHLKKVAVYIFKIKDYVQEKLSNLGQPTNLKLS